MKELGKTTVETRYFSGELLLKLWERGDPFPPMGKSVGVDSETEPFTAIKKDPLVVTLGVFDPESRTCWIVMWRDIPEFMRQLCLRDIEQRYFNVGFDQQVLDNEDDKLSVIAATDAGRVRDMQIRIHLNELATMGWIRFNLYSLAGCAKHFLHIELDKGDKDDPDNSVRMSFRRFKEDGSDTELTYEQAKYLGWDCVATWGLGEAVEEQPTEETHTKGMIVLANIATNGMRVDPIVYDALEAKLRAARDRAREGLIQFGFPDPYRNQDKERDDIKNFFYSQYKELLQSHGLEPELLVEEYENEAEELVYNPTMPKKVNFRMMICYMYNFSEDADFMFDCVQSVKHACENEKQTMVKAAKDMYDKLMEEYELLAFDESRKALVMPALIGRMLESYNNQTAEAKGFDFQQAVEHACDYMDQHPELLETDPPVGPRKFFQNHVEGLLLANPELELDRTEKSGEIQLTSKDKWRLDDLGIEDKFINIYMEYTHIQHYLSTYVNREHVNELGFIHTRFTNILRTGRTSSTRPNIQNIPARDEEFPMRLQYQSYEDTVLCATDFSFVELCGFAQSCYSRFGVSVMREVINAGLDPHRWFAGVMDKLITPDLKGASDPIWVKDMNIFLKATVSDAARQKAKAANFGSEVICFSYLALLLTKT